MTNKRNWKNNRRLYHIVWDEHNPDNPWKPGYVIHHKNGKTWDDEISNLQLMTTKEHGMLHNSGKSLSEIHKKKISEANKGHFVSEETKIKIGLKSLGNKYHLDKHHTEETKHKLAEANKGRSVWNKGKQFSEESRKKMSISQTGKKLSEETKVKMSESQKIRWATIGRKKIV